MLEPLSLLPLESAFAMALIIISLFGVSRGKVSHTFWLSAGLRILFLATTTALTFTLNPE